MDESLLVRHGKTTARRHGAGKRTGRHATVIPKFPIQVILTKTFGGRFLTGEHI